MVLSLIPVSRLASDGDLVFGTLAEAGVIEHRAVLCLLARLRLCRIVLVEEPGEWLYSGILGSTLSLSLAE